MATRPNRIGYGVNFIDRYKLMQIMTGQLEGKGLVKTSCRVNSIKEEAEYATVETDDGFSLTADVVVGVDGVRSCVRRFINSSCSRGKAPETEGWSNPGRSGVQQTGSDRLSKTGMSASFATVYGMSSPTKGIEEGERFALYRERETLIGFTGKDGVVFWFVFEQLGRTHSLSDSPRYTPEDAQTLCESLAHLQVTPSLKFGDLYNNRTVALKIAVEEGVAKRWNTDRVVIAGDAAHKVCTLQCPQVLMNAFIPCYTANQRTQMTPAGGQGANQAIESVAILVNHYMKALRIFPDGKIPRDILYYILTLYSQERKKQSAVAVQRSKMVCEALFCGPGPAGAMVRDMLKMPDEEWLSRAFMALSEAPVIDDLGLTPRGLLYQKTMKSVRAGAN